MSEELTDEEALELDQERYRALERNEYYANKRANTLQAENEELHRIIESYKQSLKVADDSHCETRYELAKMRERLRERGFHYINGVLVSDDEIMAGCLLDGSPLPTPESIDPTRAISQETVDALLKGTGKATRGDKELTDDYRNPGDIAEIGARGIKRWVRQPDEVRHKGGADCPSCGGVGFFWHGWFSCDSCQAIALGETGETYLPEDRDDE